MDVPSPERVLRAPDKTIKLLSGKFAEGNLTITNVELRLFTENRDPILGPYSLLTVLLQTDKGDVESLYDEGYRGNDILERSAELILNNLGLSGIILRLRITLENELKKKADG